MNGDVFEVTSDDIMRLSPDAAVTLLRKLLWAEASRIGIGKNLIDVPSAINVKDGGIDAQVTGVPTGLPQAIIKEGFTGYQAKTGNFSLSVDANVREVLFSKTSGDLLPRVKSCIEKKGTLVVVLFGSDNPDMTDDAAKKKFTDALEAFNPAYKGVKVEVWRPNQIAEFLQPFPSLRLTVLGLRNDGFCTHQEWLTQSDMNLPLEIGDVQGQFIEGIRTALRNTAGEIHVRVTGEPGIGKTRLVMESLRQEDLAPLVCYFQSPQDLYDSSIINHILLRDNLTTGLLIVDECDPTNRADIWRKIQPVSPRIKLITIYTEPDNAGGCTIYINPVPLAEAEVTAILRTYGVPPESMSRYVPFCDGSPRIAHILGQNLRNNPEDPSRDSDIVRAWDRFIAGREKLDTPTFALRKQILMELSLFKQFAYSGTYSEEGRTIAKRLEATCGITQNQFRTTVAELRDRKVLQGRTTLYITPRLFHIWLWIQWWNTHGVDGLFDFDEFLTVEAGPPVKLLPDALVTGFFDMFRYARDSQAAMALVNRLLSVDGIFTLEFLDTERGSRFFWSLAEADPPGALRCINRTLGRVSAERLQDFVAGRRNIINALQGIAVWRELFCDAARILLAFAEAENETWSNNASGVFADLFSLGMGPLAPTEERPEERLSVLQEALESPSSARRGLGLRAFAAALKTGHYARMVGPERQGLRRAPELWLPKTYGELFNAQQTYWNELRNSIERLSSDESKTAVMIMLDSARGLTQTPTHAPMIVETLRAFVEQGKAPVTAVLKEAEQILYYDSQMTPEVSELWTQLRDELTGTTFPALLRRFVGMDLLTDRVDKNHESVNTAKPRIKELAEQAVKDPALLTPELEWLMTTEAQNGYAFGYALGKLDEGFHILQSLYTALYAGGQSSSGYTLGGYFTAFREHDEELWERELDILASDAEGVIWVAELTWRSGALTDRGGQRILRLAQEGKVGIQHLRMFAFGSSVATLSEDTFSGWLDYLMSFDTCAEVALALNLADFYYMRVGGEVGTLPEQPLLSLLTHPVLFNPEVGCTFDTMTDYYWTELGKKYVIEYPAHGHTIANLLLEHIADDSTIAGGFQPQSREVLDEFTRRNPESIWDTLRAYLDEPLSTRGLHLRWWLKGEGLFEASTPGSSHLIPANLVWDWVDENPDKRAHIAASFIPPVISNESNVHSLAYELLVRYGDREDVRSELAASYFTHGWMGPMSAHYSQLKEHLESIRRSANNANVRNWLDDQLSHITHSIERALADEEREEY